MSKENSTLEKVRYRLFNSVPQIILIALVVFFSFMTDGRFLRVNNLISVVRQISTTGIACLGLAILIMTGNLDFAMGSIYAFTGTFTVVLYAQLGVPIYLAMLLSLVGAMLLSCLIGWISMTFHVPRLMVSMAMQTTITGLNVIISGNKTLYGLPESIKWLGQGYIWKIPISVILFIVLALMVSFMLNKTYLGRYILAVGGNSNVARLSGINVNKISYIASALGGLLCGLAGLVAMSRTFCGSPTGGASISSDLISAAVLGGVSISGGVGKTSGLVTGIIVIGVLSVGLNMMNMGSTSQDIFKGGMLVLAIILDSQSKKRAVKVKQ